MPLYDFRCPNGHLNSDVLQHCDAPAPVCPQCQEPTEVLPPIVAVLAWGEYVDHRLGEDPVTITSPNHYKRVLKDRNMAVMHDQSGQARKRKQAIERYEDLRSPVKSTVLP